MQCLRWSSKIFHLQLIWESWVGRKCGICTVHWCSFQRYIGRTHYLISADMPTNFTSDAVKQKPTSNDEEIWHSWDIIRTLNYMSLLQSADKIFKNSLFRSHFSFWHRWSANHGNQKSISLVQRRKLLLNISIQYALTKLWLYILQLLHCMWNCWPK